MTSTLRGWMMTFDERVTWFLLGVLVGWLIGKIKELRRGEIEIKEKLEEVDKNVKKQRRQRDESGIVRYPLAADIVLFGVVIMTVWAAFATAKTNAELEKQGQRIEAITACNQQYLYKTIEALNERTTYTQTTADANVELQQGLADFIDILLFQPPKTPEERYAALQKFDRKLAAYVESSLKQKGKTSAYPYPTEEELSACLGYDDDTTKETEQHDE